MNLRLQLSADQRAKLINEFLERSEKHLRANSTGEEISAKAANDINARAINLLNMLGHNQIGAGRQCPNLPKYFL